MSNRPKLYRVKRFRLRGGSPYLDKVMSLNEQSYKEAMKRTKHHSGSGDVWFENYPYRWYEFHRLRLFFVGLLTKIRSRYTKPHSSMLYIKDVSIVVIGGSIVTYLVPYLYGIFMCWIKN